MTKTRLNNFILWCKGWYKSVNDEIDILDEALIALKLDGYEFATKNHVLGIVLNYIDEMIDKKIIDSRISALRPSRLHKSISENMHFYKLNYNEALAFTIMSLFKYELTKDNITLNPPVYSRKLYKMGFVAPTILGNSYKLANYKAQKYFKKYFKK